MSAEELVAIARAIKTRGLKGEIVAESLTDFPERFDGLEELTAVAPNGQRFVLTLTRYWFQGPRIVLQFAGYDTPERARELIGCELTVPESEAVELLEDEFYDWELVGCRVETLTGEHLGQVREVLHYGPNEVLAIDAANQQREYLIPFATAICVEVDVENKLIRVNPPDGLLDW